MLETKTHTLPPQYFLSFHLMPFIYSGISSYMTHCEPVATRLLCPRDFPGKSTGVGAMFLYYEVILFFFPFFLFPKCILWKQVTIQSTLKNRIFLYSFFNSNDYQDRILIWDTLNCNNDNVDVLA